MSGCRGAAACALTQSRQTAAGEQHGGKEAQALCACLVSSLLHKGLFWTHPNELHMTWHRSDAHETASSTFRSTSCHWHAYRYVVALISIMACFQQVSKKKAEAWASSKGGIPYFETSAKVKTTLCELPSKPSVSYSTSTCWCHPWATCRRHVAVQAHLLQHDLP